jgi:hypothetical protein
MKDEKDRKTVLIVEDNSLIERFKKMFREVNQLTPENTRELTAKEREEYERYLNDILDPRD